jgi:MarR family transcriptional regulator, transcriptional regulator for hemolysin
MATTRALRPEADLAFLLAQASHALATELTARLSEIGITPRSYCVLSKALDDELTQSQVGELCALDKTTMVVTLDALERDGLAERRPSRTDRRARIIAVTEAGERVVVAGDAIVALTYSDVLAALPESQRASFLDSLTRLVEGRLSAAAACDKPPRRRAPRAPAAVS